jgi:hypothetical protein
MIKKYVIRRINQETNTRVAVCHTHLLSSAVVVANALYEDYTYCRENWITGYDVMTRSPYEGTTIEYETPVRKWRQVVVEDSER